MDDGITLWDLISLFFVFIPAAILWLTRPVTDQDRERAAAYEQAVRQQQAAAGFSIADEIEKLDWRDGFAPTALLGPLAALAVGVTLLLNPDRSPDRWTATRDRTPPGPQRDRLKQFT